MKKINFGVAIPTGTEGLMYPIPFSKVRDNIKIAIEAEKFGYDSVWGNDHIITQKYVEDEFKQHPNYFSPLLVLASIAENTKTLKIATALLVMPFRNPLVVAKELVTLDHLSNGRVIIGAGLGAYRQEFEALFGEKASKMNRGEMLDESLEIIKELFNEDIVTYKGKYFNIFEAQSFPKPIQKPFPFYIGGNSPKGRERVVKFGTGWLPSSLTPEEIKVGIDDIRLNGKKFERETQNIDIAPQMTCSIAKTHEEAVRNYEKSQLYIHKMSLKKSTFKNQDIADYNNRIFFGSPDEICEQVQNYIDAGVTTFSAMLFANNSLEEVLDSMQFFAEEVITKFNR